ncbi:hypothetical protein V2A60_002288 [Cordyceps javanica]|uniref:Chromosome segregation in meiosis protein n=1 Tax=Cordyceps javanica TaxID=43265 RepID=A0A545VHS7_9HYPO|nr:replication fork protection component Swi3 [Cordyceps javanica]TQW12432.1 replication fork protection component Swi3 [Cordyceps javanica]
MPSATKSAAGAASADRHDALDNYNVGDLSDDPFATPSPPSKNKRKSKDAGLGIDEEVDVQKAARAPTVKLDESRLLSEAGIPRLRKRAQGLKLKGKGHEFSDMSRLLSFYQLWLDDLYPKARFLDALAMVEKAGHKKRLMVARGEWLDERRPKSTEDKEDDPFDLEDRPDTAADAIAAVSLPERPTAGRLIQDRDGAQRPSTPTRDHPDDFSEDDDLYNVTPRAGPRPGLTALQPDAPDDDDLDALMAEAEDHDSRRPVEKAVQPQEDGDDMDDLIAEAEAQDSRPKSIFGNPSASKPAETDWDDDEAALREMEGF